MTETRRMQLHLGKCIDDLDKLHNVPDLKSKRARLLCKTAQKLFEEAEKYRHKGDEEYSYVYYMKYLRVVAFLSKDEDYQKDKSFYNNMLGPKNPNKAIDMAEKLKNSLIHRYDLEQQAVRMEQQSEENMRKMATEPPAVEPAPNYGIPGPDEVTIKCEQLYPILNSGKLKVMILDVRPKKDFMESHIKYPACISVPEECIWPGQSANVLEQNLPPASRPVWADRASMDLIVMLDWNSTTLIPGKPMFLLKTILLRWDVKVQYSRDPLALWGGYEDWLLRYPSFTTNPQAVLPSVAAMMEDMLGGIEYPTWTEVSPAAIPASSAGRVSKPGEPYVDRSSKAAAVQIYEERARSMQLILEQQERIADNSLTLEMQRIEAEQDWERVRGQSETENRNDLRAMYKLREQEIISQLMQLENKQYDMAQENQTLREQLEEYQRKEKEELERRESVEETTEKSTDREHRQLEQQVAARELAAKRARIAAVNEQRDQLDRQRELMESERKRKLAEARDKKKPDLEKQDEDGDTYMASPGDSPSSTTVNRSRSSPDIAEPGSEDEEPLKPSFDRSTKPLRVPPSDDHRQRNFEPICGEVGRGLTGLQNLGNTCYMNSIIQCLNNTAILVTYFCNGTYLEHLNRLHSTRGAVAEEMAAVVSALWCGNYRYISCRDLLNELGRHQRVFRSGQQQDSHEFLTILMDWLHLDLQFTIKPPPKDTMTPSEKAWHEFTKAKESYILRLFYGQIKSTVKCTVCGKQSVTYESFSNLSLELPANANRCTLADCLRLYLNGEPIPGWNCPNCKEKRDAVKKLDISRLPPILVIHFKRFYVDEYSSNIYRKKQTYIDFPLTDLDMKQFSCPGSHLYDLYAVSNHYGTMDVGHYTAYCKSSVYGKWYKYDDHAVTEESPKDVQSSAAYILFYTSCRTV